MWNVSDSISPFQRAFGTMTQSVGERLRDLRATFPRAFGIVVTILTLLVAANVAAAARLWRFRSEITQLRASMSEAERRRTDLAITSRDNRAKVVAELVRRQARADRDLHLAVEVDSGRLLLERDGVALRDVPVTIGAERLVGIAPDTVRVVLRRGAQTVTAIFGAKDTWDVPAWLVADRGFPLPPDLHSKGLLGRDALGLNGGGVIYALPKDGPLADSTYVLPGSIMLRSDDLRAIAPNIVRGMTVYLYD